MKRLIPICLILMLLPMIAWAELPAEEIWREGLIGQHMGFGNPTGGQGGTLCTVTTLADSGAGSLRSCAFDQSNKWVIFSVSGNIELDTGINPGSNITIDGRGADITISSTTAIPLFWINSVSNVIVTNLKFGSSPETAIDVRDSFVVGSENFWFDHLTFFGIGDEAIGVDCANEGGPGLPGITISWSHFTDNGQPGGLLLSYAVDVPDLSCHLNTQFTVHHNYYDQRMRRNPLMRQAKVHGFNNYHKNTQTCASPPCMAVDVRNQGQYYSENEIFECGGTYCCADGSCNETSPPYVGGRWPRIVTTNMGGEGPPNNTKRVGTYSVTGLETYETDLNPGSIFNPSSFYNYTAVTANSALRDAIVAGAGWQPSVSGLVGHWPLDGAGTSTIASDASGNSLHGELCNGATCPQQGPTWVAGPRESRALQFDGTNDWVRVPHHTLLDITGDMTIAAWVKRSSTSVLGSILSKTDQGTVWNYDLAFCPATGVGSCSGHGNQLFFYGDGLNPSFVFSTATVSDTTTWHHVALVKSGTSYTFYLDGTAAGTGTYTTATMEANTDPLAIGTDESFLVGSLDDVRLYNVALSEAEIDLLIGVPSFAAPANLRVVGP
jgi:pectate lyase